MGVISALLFLHARDLSRCTIPPYKSAISLEGAHERRIIRPHDTFLQGGIRGSHECSWLLLIKTVFCFIGVLCQFAEQIEECFRLTDE
jgi:hypothetical protein